MSPWRPPGWPGAGAQGVCISPHVAGERTSDKWEHWADTRKAFSLWGWSSRIKQRARGAQHTEMSPAHLQTQEAGPHSSSLALSRRHMPGPVEQLPLQMTAGHSYPVDLLWIVSACFPKPDWTVVTAHLFTRGLSRSLGAWPLSPAITCGQAPMCNHWPDPLCWTA